MHIFFNIFIVLAKNRLPVKNTMILTISLTNAPEKYIFKSNLLDNLIVRYYKK